jgi:large subunit ribosomal protein L29
MAIGSKGLSPADLDELEDSVLAEKLAEAKTELFNLRFSSVTTSQRLFVHI